VDADERILEAGIVDDHRLLGELDVGDVDRAYEDPTPLERPEAVLAEGVERAGEDHRVGLLVRHHGRDRAERQLAADAQRDGVVV